MKITLQTNGFFFRVSCCICEQYFDLGEAKAQAIFDDGDKGDVCQECLRGGLAGMKRRAQEAADRAMEWAKQSQENAKWLQGQTFHVPDASALEEMKEAACIERFGIPPSEMPKPKPGEVF
jgi:hypothetical protein